MQNKTTNYKSLHLYRGFSLIEMMVAVTISMILLTGVVAVVMNSSESNRELRKISEQMDNGRYASQFLKEEIRHAGFYGQLYRFNATLSWRDTGKQTQFLFA